MAGRRTHGDGALFKRADGYWVTGIELLPGPDGKRRTKRIVRKNRNDALAALRKLRSDYDAGRLATAPTTTVERWMSYWLTDILPHRDVKPGTSKSYSDTIRLYVTPRLGAKRMDRVQPADIRDLYKHLRATVSSRAAQKADQVLRLAFNAAVRDGVIGASVMDRVDKPSHLAKDQIAFPAATAMHIIETAVATQGPMWGARWAVGFTTGARECEVLGLEWDRVDLDRAVIDISWQLQRLQKMHGCGDRAADGGFPCGKKRSSFCPQAHWDLPATMQWRECERTLVFTRPKTKAGTRLVPLVPDMVDVLRSIRNSAPNPHGLVFHHPDGRPFSQDQDQKAWRKLLQSAGIPHVSQHTVRHSTATLLLEAGVDSHITQQVIGHSNVTVTRGYQHVDLELARQAWGNLAQVIPALPKAYRLTDQHG